ncbi:hypothetical protein EU537_09545 [Candidatus Thorarchaeota archaeon]|nr:MAG: hypothetical protein EU537_09545 [Candidatus Thorarchaeota archaeon]
MKSPKLTEDRLQDAVRFIESNARQLDRRYYEYFFEDASSKDVLSELSKYQNKDGGFGHAIEPDFRMRSSSPMATSVALQYYTGVDGPEEEELIERAIKYLIQTFDVEQKYWPATTMEVNDSPHAPWWHLREVKRPQGADWANPSAELAGYLFKYPYYVPEDLLDTLSDIVMDYVEMHDYVDSWLYNVMCWERVYYCFPTPLRTKIEQMIRATFQHYRPMQKDTLNEIRIFWIAPHPTSLMAQVDRDTVMSMLEEEIDNQAADGGWWPTWRWGQYEEVWPTAEKEWAGKITTEALRGLDSFNMIRGRNGW